MAKPPLPADLALAEHDRHYHPHGYDPDRDNCRLREKLGFGGAKADRADEIAVPSVKSSHYAPTLPWFQTRPYGGWGAALSPVRSAPPPPPRPPARFPDGPRTTLDAGPIPGATAVLPDAEFDALLAAAPEADRIVALSDIHDADMDGLDPEGSGTVVIAGDFVKDGATSESRQIDLATATQTGIAWLEGEFFPLCRENANRTFLVIAGNHDHVLSTPEAAALEWPPNLVFLSDSGATVGGMKVYGTPWCEKRRGAAVTASSSPKAQYAVQPYEVTPEEAAERFAEIPEGLDMLIVHQPPAFDGFDGDGAPGSHYGSKALADAILRAKPKLVICGHQHEGDHRPFRLGSSVVVNVAYVGASRYDQAHAVRDIVVDRDPAKGIGYCVAGESDQKLPEPDFEDEDEPLFSLHGEPALPGLSDSPEDYAEPSPAPASPPSPTPEEGRAAALAFLGDLLSGI